MDIICDEALKNFKKNNPRNYKKKGFRNGMLTKASESKERKENLNPYIKGYKLRKDQIDEE